MKKRELTLRVRDEAVHLNLNHSLKQPELNSADCEIAETKILGSFKLATACNFQNSMNENEMNIQYLKHFKVEVLNSNFNLKDLVLEKSVQKDPTFIKKKL